jgi:hypothetical protein
MSEFRKYLLLIPCFALLTGCVTGFGGIPGSGVSRTESRDLGEFHAISHDAVGAVTVTVGQPHSVKVTFDDNLLSLVETRVVDGELKIKTTGSFNSTHTLDVQITVPAVESLKVSGVGSLNAAGIESDNIELKLSGVGSLKVEGKTKNLDLNVSGVGSAELKALEAESARVIVSGVGGATVYATESVDVHTSGVGGVRVFGNPKDPKIKSTGIGKVTMED